MASMVSEQGEAIGGYPQHLPSQLPRPPQAVLGDALCLASTRVLPATAPGRGGHGLVGLPGTQWGLGKFQRSEPLLATLHALPTTLGRPSPSGRPARGRPLRGGPLFLLVGASGPPAPHPAPSSQERVRWGLAVRGELSCPCGGSVPSTRGPPPHQPSCLAVWPQGFPAPPPVPGCLGRCWATARGPQERGGFQCPEPLG